MVRGDLMEKCCIVVFDIECFYVGLLHNVIFEYKMIKIVYVMVTRGGYMLCMFGYFVIGLEGIIGKGDMCV